MNTQSHFHYENKYRNFIKYHIITIKDFVNFSYRCVNYINIEKSLDNIKNSSLFHNNLLYNPPINQNLTNDNDKNYIIYNIPTILGYLLEEKLTNLEKSYKKQYENIFIKTQKIKIDFFVLKDQSLKSIYIFCKYNNHKKKWKIESFNLFDHNDEIRKIITPRPEDTILKFIQFPRSNKEYHDNHTERQKMFHKVLENLMHFMYEDKKEVNYIEKWHGENSFHYPNILENQFVLNFFRILGTICSDKIFSLPMRLPILRTSLSILFSIFVKL